MLKRLAFLIAVICVSWIFADTLQRFDYDGFLWNILGNVLVAYYAALCSFSLLYAFVVTCLLKEIFKRKGPLPFLETHRLHDDDIEPKTLEEALGVVPFKK